MPKFIFSVVAILSFAATALSGPVAEPLITPAPLVRRDDDPRFIGYASAGVGYWTSVVCNIGYTFTAAGDYYKCCPVNAACDWYTGCDGRFIQGATEADCLAVVSAAYCTSDILFPSSQVVVGATSYYCANVGVAGSSLFRQDPTATPTPSSTPTPISTPTSSPTPTPSLKSPVGAIVGGVIGGLAVLGLIAVGALFILKKKRNHNGAAPDPANDDPALVSTTQPPPPKSDEGKDTTNSGSMSPGPLPRYSDAPIPAYQQQPMPAGGSYQHQQPYQQPGQTTYYSPPQSPPPAQNLAELESPQRGGGASPHQY